MQAPDQRFFEDIRATGNEPLWDPGAYGYAIPGMKTFHQFLEKYLPEANRADSSAMVGYNTAQSMVEVLRRCGDVLTRENIMKQAASFRNFEQGGLLPGITVNTSLTEFAPIKQLRLMRFEGDRWQLFGDIITGAIDE